MTMKGKSTTWLAKSTIRGTDQVLIGGFPTFADYTSLYVVKSSKNLPAAYAFVTRLIRPEGQKGLVKYGFGPRPKPTG